MTQFLTKDLAVKDNNNIVVLHGEVTLCYICFEKIEVISDSSQLQLVRLRQSNQKNCVSRKRKPQGYVYENIIMDTEAGSSS